jgi:hypothetical protein
MRRKRKKAYGFEGDVKGVDPWSFVPRPQYIAGYGYVC